MDACIEGHTDIVKLLLDFSETRGIDLNVTNNKGCTGFMEAIKAGQTKVVKLLLDSAESKQIETHTWDNDGHFAECEDVLNECNSDNEERDSSSCFKTHKPYSKDYDEFYPESDRLVLAEYWESLLRPEGSI